jgi:hypothetical protein
MATTDRGPAKPLPQHNRPDGRWCRWSGVDSTQPDGLCPDRCQTEYPTPEHISYDEDSRWCQDHGHSGLLVAHPGLSAGCPECEHLIATDPRFAAALTEHLPNGTRKGAPDSPAKDTP